MQRVGTAGWSLPAKPAEEGTHLYHYSRALPCVEINSTFYRAHRAATWRKWAAETPAAFRFSIKAPRAITHEAALHNPEPLLTAFLEQLEPIREKAGPILFQLPPSLAFDAALAEDFFAILRDLYQGEAVLEPRHASWFRPSTESLLHKYAIARAAADPPKGAPEAARPGGVSSLIYYRLHGAPRTYYSRYEDHSLRELAAAVACCRNAWIIFDNTALGHAYFNALRLEALMAELSGGQPAEIHGSIRDHAAS